MDIIVQVEVREAHVARGEAECYIMLRELPRACINYSCNLSNHYLPCRSVLVVGCSEHGV